MEDTTIRRSAASPEGFGFIFWGLILVVLDFSINQFDILPDFLGYILMAIGAGKLALASNHFRIAGFCCWILVIMSLLNFMIRGDLATAFGLAHGLVNGIMIWFLLGGIMETTSTYQQPHLAQRASVYRIIYIVLMSITTLISFMFRGNLEAGILVILVVISFLALMILILTLIWQTKKLTLSPPPARISVPVDL